MKAVQTADLSSIDNYSPVDLPAPQPGEGEVRIRVAACGVGFVDALVALGRYQVKPSLPHVPGAEIGGLVDALGAGVTGVAIGERVLAQARGGFAEYAIAPERAVSRIPDRMSMNQAAGFRVNYGTALHGLRDRAALKAGETLVVIGAAGGVGLAAVQVGRLLGANVIGVASTAQKRVVVEEAGAGATLDRVVDGWRERLKAVSPNGVDVVFDPVSGPLLQPAFRSLGWGGRYLIVGFAGGDIPALPVNLPLLKGAALVGVDYRQFGAVFEADAAACDLKELLAWVAKGELDVPVGRTFPFGEYREALEYALSGDGTGKTILVVDPSIG
ncbi:NADPH:quinone oxidoreductase family protein [Reyranella sp.]|uniref:NADPH:quinone oxidoreductase family protein n=1 Tax=Reyranella sp. TaxID=1929291 RepID=UPI0027258CB8|nr:NADPH:quinone oxidoreductase family protein [Reyranella sp.]MDO8976456.1 NADPH:quinone oxidoreductase family protein [Reyranella sp.]